MPQFSGVEFAMMLPFRLSVPWLLIKTLPPNAVLVEVTWLSQNGEFVTVRVLLPLPKIAPPPRSGGP
jgi:hypothetical protein